MPNFNIEDIKIIIIGGFVHIKGKVQVPEINRTKLPYSQYPFKVYIKAKRIGTNDFYYSKANIDSILEKSAALFDGALDLPGDGRNYKVWVEVTSQQDRVGTKTDEMDLTVN